MWRLITTEFSGYFAIVGMYGDFLIYSYIPRKCVLLGTPDVSYLGFEADNIL